MPTDRNGNELKVGDRVYVKVLSKITAVNERQNILRILPIAAGHVLARDTELYIPSQEETNHAN